MWFRLKTLQNSFKYAWKGFRYTFRNEQNFRIQIVIALVVIILMFVLQVRAIEAVALIFMIIAVLVLEILNTILEYFVDLLKPRLHHYSQIIKDMMAAAVLLTAIGAIIVGAIIFYPYIIH